MVFYSCAAFFPDGLDDCGMRSAEYDLRIYIGNISAWIDAPLGMVLPLLDDRNGS